MFESTSCNNFRWEARPRRVLGYVWRCKWEIVTSLRYISPDLVPKLVFVCCFAFITKWKRHCSTHAQVLWNGITRILCFSSEDMEFCVLHFQTSSSVGKLLDILTNILVQWRNKVCHDFRTRYAVLHSFVMYLPFSSILLLTYHTKDLGSHRDYFAALCSHCQGCVHVNIAIVDARGETNGAMKSKKPPFFNNLPHMYEMQHVLFYFSSFLRGFCCCCFKSLHVTALKSEILLHLFWPHTITPPVVLQSVYVYQSSYLGQVGYLLRTRYFLEDTGIGNPVWFYLFA